MAKKAKCTCPTPGHIRESCPIHGDEAISTEPRVVVLRNEDGEVVEVAWVRTGETPDEAYRRRCQVEAEATESTLDEAMDMVSYETFPLVP